MPKKGYKPTEAHKKAIGIASKNSPHYFGEKSPNWKADGVKYHGIHQWLRVNYGRANWCESIICNKKSNRHNWCLIRGKKHERKRENYIQLCVSCHRKYDNSFDRDRLKKIGELGRKNRITKKLS